MANNTQLNPGVSGDVIRDVDRAGVKTQVTILDVGGSGAESLLTKGQALAAASVPVVLASDQPAVPVSGTVAVSGTVPVSIAANAPVEQAGLTAGALNADLVAATDVSVYKWFSLQVAGTWSGTLSFQGSNDNVNWVSIVVANSGSTTQVVTTTAANGIYTGPCNYKYLRVRMTAYTSGTATGTLEIYPLASALNVSATLATQNGTWTVQPGNTANTTAWKVDGSAVTQPVSAASLPLPSGAATSANQATSNTSLASIDTKTPALGQALAGSSVPVVLTAAQLTTLTPVSALTDTQLRATAVPVSAASLPLPALAATSTKQSDGSQKTQIVDGSGNVVGATGNAVDVNIKTSAVTRTTTEKWVITGSSASLIAGSALNALANNALVLGPDYNNVQGGGSGDGYTFCRLTLTFKFQVSPTANTGLSLWFIRSSDNGTTFEDGGTSVTPARAPDAVFPTSADANTHVVMRDVLAPPGHWKPLLKNDGTGQALTANNTDNTLAITNFTRQSV